MEDGVKEDPATPKEVKFTVKAGWLKKSSGKFLGTYKDRYVQLDRTEISVYESEDLKNCLEQLDLENFDKCHEIRSPFKKKNRLILIRSPKSGCKVSDVKLQAQNQEDKDAWIKALTDGINRAKNKIFDEVKVDENSSLEHVTRSRPKGNRSRRPPTRIHMKEAAHVSSDGILRLDLDAVDSTPNGMHFLPSEESKQREVAKPLITPSKSLDDIPDESTGDEPAPVKKVVKPPMPPSKEIKPCESQDSEAPQKKVLTPPMPPSKEKKPTENKDMEPRETQEKKALKPPMPPSKENKPVISANEDATVENASDSGVETGEATTLNKLSSTPDEADDTEPSESSPPKNITSPPTPPSKDKKPSKALTSEDKEGVAEESEDADDKNAEDSNDEKDGEAVKDVKDDSSNSLETAEEKEENEEEEEKEEKEEEKEDKVEDITITLSNNVSKVQGVMWDSPSTAPEEGSVEQDVNESASSDTTHSVATTEALEEAKPVTENEISPHSTLETVKKVPPAPPKKKPVKIPIKTEDSGLQSGPAVSTSSSLPATVTSSTERDSETEKVPLNDTKPDIQETKDERKVVILSISNPGKTEEPEDVAGHEVEQKSIDSGQLSAEDSETGDQVTSSTDKLQDSLQGLDGETSEEDLESSDSKVPSVDDPSPAILTVETAVPNTPAASLNSSSKTKSASTGHLLELDIMPQGSNMKDLQSKISTELEETGKLLGSEGESNPVILQTSAMEKLKEADELFKEAKSIKELEKKRTSW